MNTTTTVLLAIAGVFAVGNWYSRAPGGASAGERGQTRAPGGASAGERGQTRSRESRLLEFCTKPTVTALLLVAAFTIDPRHSGARVWFVVALVLSLCGDVFLMLPREQFVAGLGSFLLAHVAYVIGFLVEGVRGTAMVVGSVVVLLVFGTIARTVLRAVRSKEPALLAPVALYHVVIATMVVCSIGSTKPLAVIGAGLFALSDSLIAWDRFVRPFPAAGIAIMVTYHVGQLGLLLSLTH